MAAGSSLGGAIFPIMVKGLVAERDLRWSIRAAAFLILGLLIYANLTVKSRLPPQPKPWNIMKFIKPLREVPFLLTVLASFAFFFGMFLPFNFIILSAESNGMSANLAGYLVAVLNAVSIFGPYILFAAFYGFSSGAFVALAPALIAQISDIRQIGVRTGTMCK
ncbi:hypothetical protein HO133_005120 [Letharia lupina]|uniref:Major facilitator superfamily (MFS) profile domain-containing protein n=1 Tax=Letharia lupina TaxID=560253 RepID=A0A8H6C9C5_9LECA|nr:uncharacterized protein HO133_005120 [Letharia lupina]KAF6219295.1 hypothetical protein HO133_005120 [Letharia lupina]